MALFRQNLDCSSHSVKLSLKTRSADDTFVIYLLFVLVNYLFPKRSIHVILSDLSNIINSCNL